MPVLSLDNGIIKQNNGVFLEGYSNQVRDGQYRLKTSQFRNIADLRFTSPAKELVWKEELVGSGSSTDLGQVAARQLQVSGGGTSRVTLQSRARYHCVPPYTQLVWFSVTIGNPSIGQNVQKRIGIFDDTDGIILELSGLAQPKFIIKSDTNSQLVEIERPNWDDPLDGTGESGITLNADFLNLYFLEYSWGGGYARFGVMVNGIPYIAHTEYFGNAGNTTPMFAQPNLPVRFEIDAPAGGVISDMIVYGATVQADAAQRSKGLLRSVDRGAGSNAALFCENTALNTPIYHCVAALRLKNTLYSGVIRLIRTFLQPSTSTIYHYALVYNATQTEGDPQVWTSLANSSLEYFLGNHDQHFTFDQGDVLMSGYDSAATDHDIQEVDDSLILLGNDQVGTRDEIYLLVAHTSGLGGMYLYGGFQFREFL